MLSFACHIFQSTSVGHFSFLLSLISSVPRVVDFQLMDFFSGRGAFSFFGHTFQSAFRGRLFIFTFVSVPVPSYGLLFSTVCFPAEVFSRLITGESRVRFHERKLFKFCFCFRCCFCCYLLAFFADHTG